MAFGDKIKAIDFEALKQAGEAVTQEDRIHLAARVYLEAGYFLVPLDPKIKGGKSLPSSKKGVTYEHASNSLKTIDKWFGIGGAFRGYNLGIACGRWGGAFVVDVDVVDKHGNKGFESLAMLEEQHGKMPETQIQESANGGKHFIFQWANGGVKSEGRVAGAIDTRGGEDNRCKSHIVVYPSVRSDTDGEYAMIPTTEAPAEIPLWVLEELTKPKNRGFDGGGRGNDEVDDEDVETEYSPRQIKKMLSHIDPDDLDYEDWLIVLQAVHSQHPNNEGFKLANAWSKRGARYEPNEVEVRWKSFDESGEIRIGSLIYFAQQGGFNPRTEPKGADKPSQEAEDIVAEYNERFAIVTVGSKVKVLMEQFNLDPFQENFKLFSPMDFRALMASDITYMADKRGNAKVVPKAEIWYADPKRREFINGLTFQPDQPKEIDGCFNIWEGWKYGEQAGDWSLFKDHIRNMVDGNDEHFTWLLDWMADAVQDPMNPKGCAVVMKGIEGTGKGTIANVFGGLFGAHYKHIIQEEQLTGKFNGHLEEALLVFADEVTYGGNKKVAGTLKGLVTEKRLMIERKGLDATPYRNCLRLMIASNEDWFIPAGPHSRRWFVLEVPSDNASEKKYFDAIYEQMENGGYEAMFHELRSREIESDLRKAPVTATLQGQRARTVTEDSPVKAFWLDLVESGNWDVDETNGKVIRREVFESARNWASNRKGEHNQRFPSSEQQFWYQTGDVIDNSFFLVNGRKPRIGNKAAMPVPEVEILAKCIAEKLGIGEIDNIAHEWTFANSAMEGYGNDNVQSEDCA
ncbi:DUF5906 domain-containing protein [Vibrio chagasii]|uniref:DUF5906 domain-containing protein n=1 Tax=Vibrio chagasii TaxID=170679 RepID=UPI003DA1361F